MMDNKKNSLKYSHIYIIIFLFNLIYFFHYFSRKYHTVIEIIGFGIVFALISSIIISNIVYYSIKLWIWLKNKFKERQ